MAVDASGPVEPECNRHWQTCPVHGKPGANGLPSFREVLVCLYGGLETKDGTPFDYSDADYVIGRMVGRLEQR